MGKLDVSKLINSCREGDKAFIVHRGTNRSGRFLELADYMVGRRRKGSLRT